MGVKCIFPYKSATAASDVQGIEEIKERIKRIHGKKVGQWNLSCTLYLHELSKENLPIEKELYVLKEEMGGNEDGESDKSYLMIKHMILEAGDEMMSILTKTKMYKARQALVIKGTKYSVGDFNIKVGSIILGNHSKGVMVEVEYVPCVIPNQCSGILQEFIGNLGPFSTHIATTVSYQPAVLPKLYSMRHTTYQYVRLFQFLNLLRAT